MKRITYAVALGLGLMMNACGSSGSSTPAAATCVNQYGQTVAGTQVGNQCIASGAGSCTTPCAGGYLVPQLGNQCVPYAQAQAYCGGTSGYPGGTTGYPGYPYGGYGQGGYGYPTYYGQGGGYYGGGTRCYQTYQGVVCY